MDQTLEQAAEYVSKWREILGLNSWEINLTYGDVADMVSQGAVAQVVANWQYEYATIRLLPPQVEVAPGDNTDVEYAVVHELLHLIFWQFFPPADQPLARELFEQSLNKVTKALMALKTLAQTAQTKPGKSRARKVAAAAS